MPRNLKPFLIPIAAITRKHIAGLQWTNRDFFGGTTNIYLYISYYVRVLYYIYASSGFGPQGPKPCRGNNVLAWFLAKFQFFEYSNVFFPNCTRYHDVTFKYIPNNKESDSYNSYIHCGFSKAKENIFIFSGFDAIYNSSHIHVWYI